MRYRQPYALILALGLCACAADSTGSAPAVPPAAASGRPQEGSAAPDVPAATSPQATLSPDEIFATRSKSVWLLATFRLNADGKGLTPIASGSAVAVTGKTLLTSCQNLQGADVVGLRQTGAVLKAAFQGPAPQEGVCRVTVADQLPDPGRRIGREVEGSGLVHHDRLVSHRREQLRGDLATGTAVDAPLVDEPLAGDVVTVAERDPGHARHATEPGRPRDPVQTSASLMRVMAESGP